ncbi:alpha/beta hydrolase [Leifsonia sp. H3M29-4]|uniref:alpha/beta fold hydrolase n=1 Tax=Salinibacterium metalliresistens TaxID=3031321 RepID=UPI0023DA6E18|nr:alpha/beta hydrolase [Salinibacterium metalliresistens]MDF1477693.1 alpha/beta hydrolase [Salinibacterium metalliresistens]
MSHLGTLWGEVADLPHTLEYVQVGRWRTRVLTVGDGDETVVLMNGTSGHLEAWTHNIRAIAQQYRVVAYDYPGHGYTTLADADLEIADYEQHLLELLDVLGLQKPHLMGESLGGWIAIKFAIHHPDRVRTLVLSAPGGRMISAPSMNRVSPISRAAVDDPTFENVKARLQVVIHDPAKITDELVEIRRAIYSRPGFAASMAHIMALQVPEIRARNQATDEDYAAISVPTLLVWTDHEPTGGTAVGEHLAGLLPDGELVTIRDAAHWPQWEDPATFNQRALDFLHRKG